MWCNKAIFHRSIKKQLIGCECHKLIESPLLIYTSFDISVTNIKKFYDMFLQIGCIMSISIIHMSSFKMDIKFELLYGMWHFSERFVYVPFATRTTLFLPVKAKVACIHQYGIQSVHNYFQKHLCSKEIR